MKNMKKVFCVVLVAAITIFTGITAFAKNSKKENCEQNYPFIFVHGLGGVGTPKIEGKDINKYVPIAYFGATAGNLIEMLNKNDIEAYAPSLGMQTSAWDRSCELYAQLTGTRVDYGEAHSKKYGHARFGSNYDKPLFEGLGPDKKINLLGHSFGGATIRLFSTLLADGNAEELAATSENTSGLFKGGKADWVNSITTIASPHNGTTLYDALMPSTWAYDTIELFFNSIGLITNLPLLEGTVGDIYDTIMSGWLGLRSGPPLNESYKLLKTPDNAFYDLTIGGAQELNKQIRTLPNVYYYSYAFDGTKEEKNLFGKLQCVTTSEMKLGITRIPGEFISHFSGKTISGVKIDDSWRANDGLVNVISAKAPFNEPSKSFDENSKIAGIWNIMPIQRGDHAMAVGTMQTKEWLKDFYFTQVDRINALPR